MRRRRRLFILLLVLAIAALGCGAGLLLAGARARTLFGMEPSETLQALALARADLNEASLHENGAALSEAELQSMLFPGATPRMLLLLRLLPALFMAWPLVALGATLLVAALLLRGKRPARRARPEAAFVAPPTATEARWYPAAPPVAPPAARPVAPPVARPVAPPTPVARDRGLLHQPPPMGELRPTRVGFVAPSDDRAYSGRHRGKEE